MGGRRGVYLQEQEDAVAQDPTLARKVVQLSVQDDEGPELQVTENGQPGEGFLFGRSYAEGPGVTLANGAGVPNGELIPFSTTQNDFWGDSNLVLTENGFGVREGEDHSSEFSVQTLEEEEEPDLGDITLEGGEALSLNLFTKIKKPEYPEGGDGDLIEVNGAEMEFLELGGVSVKVDYEVISGSGDVMITLVDRPVYEGEPFTVETFGMAGGAGGSLSASLQEGQFFDNAELSVSGDLEIVVTGIQYVTNLGDDFLAPS